MALSAITVNVGTSGIGRRPPNTDKISGLLSFNAAYPSGFSAGAPVVKFFSLAQAVSAGIVQGSANFSVEWYHVSEFFRANPNGELWIGIYPVDNTYAVVTDMLARANGEIRQLGIYSPTRALVANVAADCALIEAIVDASDNLGYPCSVILALNAFAVTAISGWLTAVDLRTATARKVSVILSQDGAAAGKALYTAKGYSITSLGHCLGTISASTVSQSIGSVGNFNASNGTELESPALSNGDLVSALPASTMGALKDKAYTILRKYTPQTSGTYYERQGTSVPLTNAFAYFEFNRAVDKAIRLTRTALAPQINGQLFLKSNGNLRDDTVGYFTDLVQAQLDTMIANNELSAAKCTIDPTQNVLTSNTLTVAIQVIPVGIAEQIVVNIGLVTALT